MQYCKYNISSLCLTHSKKILSFLVLYLRLMHEVNAYEEVEFSVRGCDLSWLEALCWFTHVVGIAVTLATRFLGALFSNMGTGNHDN
jgi:hypothetical protein